ncbi:ankyrin repeat domain-containing protein 54-like [Copidosoma floridanum]|uniref:ankyrin repeat domain-containing protein 54-like n=1 Tax=Copidosoma floridanum TaxID=29053 RepID=UPI0006C99751|nr:ankyrin repeat domain-containing protein 54-like [Copidosoma floridanum]
MDTGLETGNESNNTTIVVPGQFISCAMSSMESVREPKLELLFKNMPKTSDALTVGGSKDEFAMDYPFVYQPASENLSLDKIPSTDCKEICVFKKPSHSMADHSLMDIRSFIKFNEATQIAHTLPREEIHDFSPKIRRRLCGNDKVNSWSHDKNRRLKKMRIAVTTNNTQLLKDILSTGVSPNFTDESQRTPLHLAASRGYTEIVKILLAHGANPNMKDTIGNTPLHLAAVTSKTEIVDLLLKAGTNVKSTDHFGNNPLDLAKTKARVLKNCKVGDIGNIKVEVENVISLLKLHLQRSNKVDAENMTAVEEALNKICSRLSLSNSTDQIQDSLKNLLSNLESLSLV